MGAVRVDGRQFAIGDARFQFRGVSYGTFQPRADGERFPERDQIKRDLAAMDRAGFTVVRTYTPPPDDLVELAADWGVHILAGVFFPDWRYLVGSSRRDLRGIARDARHTVRAVARRLAGTEHVLGLSLANEVPADVLRWFGTQEISHVLEELVDVVREEDPDQLVTYANYPTAEYLRLDGLDFVTFNVFLERQADFRRYLTRLGNLAGDRPLVIGEMGRHASADCDGEAEQARTVNWLMRTAVERGVAGTCLFSWTDDWWVGDSPVEGWHFGLTTADRSARPALTAAEKWNRRTVADLHRQWPSMSVVVCAYNAADTLDECLQHTCALDYPDLDIVVIDDGSADATAEIARRHPRARLVTIEHAGLSVARNVGFEQARGEIVAYLDSDAYPTREWPYFLALAMKDRAVAGAGGPNVPPYDDPEMAQRVARAPGGPVHVLVTDDRAEHVPGCNMAFRRDVLTEIGGFDPIYTAAGDDVDVCWRVLDRGYEIGFHPAALVWHHRRPSARAYLRQQRGYGRAEALVEARHPDRFNELGSARWVGRIYNPLVPSVGRQRVYRGPYGTAAFQSVYQGGGHLIDVVHQVGVPMAAALMLTLPLAALNLLFALPASAAVGLLVTVAATDAVRTSCPRLSRRQRLRFRLGVAALCLAQPLARAWGRMRHNRPAYRQLPEPAALPGPVHRPAPGVSLLPQDRPRAQLSADIVQVLRHRRLRVTPVRGWEDHDGDVIASSLVHGQLLTSAHPDGFVQLRVRRRPRRLRLASWTAAIAALAAVEPLVGLVVALGVVAELSRGLWRCGPLVHRAIAASAGPGVVAE